MEKSYEQRCVEAIEEIVEYVNRSNVFLSGSTEYGQGYKDGVSTAKDIVRGFLENHGLVETDDAQE